MKQESKTKDVTLKAFFIAMGFLFVLLQVAFHPEYIKYFPQFDGLLVTSYSWSSNGFMGDYIIFSALSDL